MLFYIPLFFQQAQGLGAFETGLLLLPQALVMAVIMPLAGQLYDRIGPRWPAVDRAHRHRLRHLPAVHLTIDSSHTELTGCSRSGRRGSACA